MLETMNEPVKREKFTAPLCGILVCGPRCRDEALLKAAGQGKDSCSCWVYVGGRQTKGGKSACVFSDTGAQRAFLELVCSGASPLQPAAESEREKSPEDRWTMEKS